jgi:hypothetical protein
MAILEVFICWFDGTPGAAFKSPVSRKLLYLSSQKLFVEINSTFAERTPTGCKFPYQSMIKRELGSVTILIDTSS